MAGHHRAKQTTAPRAKSIFPQKPSGTVTPAPVPRPRWERVLPGVQPLLPAGRGRPRPADPRLRGGGGAAMADRLTQLQDAVNSVRRPLLPLSRGRGARHGPVRDAGMRPPSRGNGRGCGVRTARMAGMLGGRGCAVSRR